MHNFRPTLLVRVCYLIVVVCPLDDGGDGRLQRGRADAVRPCALQETA